MARTIQQIYDEIIAEKENQPILSQLYPNAAENFAQLIAQLTSSSRVAIWRLWAYTTACAIFLHELRFDTHRATIEQLIASAEAGTLRWYTQQARAFQYGDTLIFDSQTGRYKYPTVNSVLQIVAAAAAIERPDGVVVLKVAKYVAGNLVPLATAEQSAFAAYANQIKFAGTRLAIISSNADEVGVWYNIYYSPIVPLATIKATVEAAVAAYLKNLPFTGGINVQDLTSELAAVAGVQDAICFDAKARYGTLPFTSFAREYSTFAGYAQISAAYPLSSTINYIPL